VLELTVLEELIQPTNMHYLTMRRRQFDLLLDIEHDRQNPKQDFQPELQYLDSCISLTELLHP